MHHAFHYAFKVKDLVSTRRFYIDLLGCREGRSTEQWVDFDFFGHQLSAHLATDFPPLDYCGKVDGVAVPIPHFGCILSTEAFWALQQRLEAAGVSFVVKPQQRYAGSKGEQLTLFVLDYSGNALEFKSFTHPEAIFANATIDYGQA
jgi:extradiol dioxygenase family protein